MNNNKEKLNDIITELCWLCNSYCSENNNDCENCECFRKETLGYYCAITKALNILNTVNENNN